MFSTPQRIQIFNTLTQKKEDFQPSTPGQAKIYGCGPTVYGHLHVGNARAVLTIDLIARVLEYAGYKVIAASNITDVDDKIIQAATKEAIPPGELAKRYTEVYLGELKALDVRPLDHIPRATEHVPGMIRMIEALIQKNHAYVAETPFGSDVYFRVRSDQAYGRLSKRKIEDLLVGARVEAGEAKGDPLDFALWKAAKPGEPHWTSPWGEGRPGWHIECSAMIEEIFPGGADLHTGGIDLVFPHHENEMAQSRCAMGHAPAQTWCHNGHLQLGKEKMSKSLGNFVTIEKFLEQFGHETLRLLAYQAQYRGPSDFSKEIILRTEALVERLYTCKEQYERARGGESQGAKESSAPNALLPSELQDLRGRCETALFDDFNSAKALGFVLAAARAAFRENRDECWLAWGEALPLMGSVLGVLKQNPQTALGDSRKRRFARYGWSADRVALVEAKLLERESARKSKDFARSDLMRKELENMGVIVMDGPDGVSWAPQEETTT